MHILFFERKNLLIMFASFHFHLQWWLELMKQLNIVSCITFLQILLVIPIASDKLIEIIYYYRYFRLNLFSINYFLQNISKFYI